ncbi:hypothetical protein B0H19DRAFT_187177 [Mycena capillaripes]|nr:hypothetical protein B0H19DRAFT_187177 [Mycena capillaripes]
MLTPFPSLRTLSLLWLGFSQWLSGLIILPQGYYPCNWLPKSHDQSPAVTATWCTFGNKVWSLARFELMTSANCN